MLLEDAMALPLLLTNWCRVRQDHLHVHRVVRQVLGLFQLHPIALMFPRQMELLLGNGLIQLLSQPVVISSLFLPALPGIIKYQGGGDWSITSHINLVRRSDNNQFNNAPVAIVMSPINIYANETTMISVSVSDADGDVIRCRWASNKTANGVNECASVCPPNSLPANTILYSNCTIKITGSTIGSMYALTFIVSFSSMIPTVAIKEIILTVLGGRFHQFLE